MKLSIILVLALGTSCTSDDDDSKTDEEQTFYVNGTLSLDEVGDSVASEQGLEEGQLLEGATVFVKGFQTQTATTDSSGAFTIQVHTGKPGLYLADSYKILMWYTVEREGDTAAARFGSNEDISPTLGSTDALALGEVALTFTMGLHATVEDEGGEKLTGCNISVVGIGDQLLAIDKGKGNYDIDYLPPDTYDIEFSCEGYVDQTVSDYVVEAATTLDAWQTLDTVVMVAE